MDEVDKFLIKNGFRADKNGNYMCDHMASMNSDDGTDLLFCIKEAIQGFLAHQFNESLSKQKSTD